MCAFLSHNKPLNFRTWSTKSITHLKHIINNNTLIYSSTWFRCLTLGTSTFWNICNLNHPFNLNFKYQLIQFITGFTADIWVIVCFPGLTRRHFNNKPVQNKPLIAPRVTKKTILMKWKSRNSIQYTGNPPRPLTYNTTQHHSVWSSFTRFCQHDTSHHTDIEMYYCYIICLLVLFLLIQVFLPGN